jgi:hypothetical protein
MTRQPAEPTAARQQRRSRPVDVSTFAGDVDAALTAFSADVSYAVSMARSAVTIGRKRQMWHDRKQQKNAA